MKFHTSPRLASDLNRSPAAADRGFDAWRCLILVVLWLTASCAGPSPAPLPPDVFPPAAHLPAIRFTIQVGAFSTPERASRYADKLSAEGVDAYYFIDDDGLGKVRFGRFESKEAAQAHARLLQNRGLIDEFYIVRPGSAAHRFGIREALQTDLIETARRFIGTPYQWGGESPQDGFDCSGLTMTVYRLNGLELPRSAYSQFLAGAPLQTHSLHPGDLVFFETGRSGRVSHVGIYSGHGRFIHAPGRGKHIRSASLSSSYFKSRFRGARRYF